MNLKDYIFSITNEETIIKIYLSLTDSEIEYLLASKNNRICNPLRDDDEHPSFGMMKIRYKNRTKILFIDDADSTFKGDIFDLIGNKILYKSPNNAENFIYICKHIINKLVFSKTNADIKYIPSSKPNITKKEIKELNVEVRSWDNESFRYWHNIAEDQNFSKILINQLISEYVYVADKIYYNDNLIYTYNKKDIAYVYYYEKLNTGSQIAKVYRPMLPPKNKKNPRFLTNDVKRFRYLLSNTDYASNLIIIKSFKDAIFLKSSIYLFFSSTGINNNFNFLYLQGESNMINDDILKQLNDTYINIYYFADYDKTGILGYIYHKLKLTKLKPIFIVNNSILPISNRDIMEFTLRYGFSQTVEQVLELFSNFKYRKYMSGIKDYTDLVKYKKLEYIKRIIKLWIY